MGGGLGSSKFAKKAKNASFVIFSPRGLTGGIFVCIFIAHS